MKTLPTLYKKDVSGRIRQITFFIDGNTFWAEHGLKGGVLIKDNPTVCESKNVGRVNSTTPEEQAEAEAQSRWQKKRDTGYFDKIEDVNKLAYFKPMLAHKWEDHGQKLIFDAETVLVQPKLDGIRCLTRWEDDEIVCRSRNGKEIVPVNRIRVELKNKLPNNVVLDGELYNHDLKDDFNEIVSLVRKTKPKIEDIKKCSSLIEYHVYDCFFTDSPDLGYKDRMALLRDVMPFSLPLKLVDTQELDTVDREEDLYNLYRLYLDQGYEGQMVRADSKYEQKRSKSLLKRKEFKDDEFEVIDVEEGRGKRSGMAATLKMKTHDGNIFDGAIKGKDKFRVGALENKDEIIGKKAHVRFFEYTEYGVPRFPVVHSIRDYE